MRITVRLFARLRDLVGSAEATCEVPDAATVTDVWQALEQEHPSIAPYARSVSAAVNANFARMSARVSDGDEVAFLPPVSGG